MIQKYRIFKKKPFETTQKFEQRLNEECAQVWRAISISSNNGTTLVLLERESKH